MTEIDYKKLYEDAALQLKWAQGDLILIRDKAATLNRAYKKKCVRISRLEKELAKSQALTARLSSRLAEVQQSFFRTSV